MMYQDKFVAVVKIKGKILREKQGTVTLPFGSEYTLLLKNLNSIKAQVNISIDGTDVLDGKSLIIEPNKDLELEGFLKDKIAHKKFRFINKTPQISDYRGDRIDDGIIRVEFTYEKETPYFVWSEPIRCSPSSIRRYKGDHNIYPTIISVYAVSVPDMYYSVDTNSGSIPDMMLQSSTSDSVTSNNNYTSNSQCSYTSSILNEESEPLKDEGITVKGSSCNQVFNNGYIGILEDNSSVIVLKLRGVDSNDEKITECITVRDKLTCSTCGTVSKSTADFCYKCGTALI